LFSAAPATGKKIAVIGGGPAGLACASELTKRGHEAVVFDAASKPGGLNTRGVAEYKQTRTAALAEIAWLQDLGVTVRENTVVGEDISFDELVSGYDALFFGAGLGAIPVLGVPGESLAGVEDALRLIEAVKTGALAADGFAGKTVVVLGGGNTAIDAARLAVRLGAVRTVVIYRRGPDEMPAYQHEVAEARREGVAFSFWSAPHSVIGDGKVEAMRCQRTEPGAVGADGRPSVITSDEPPYDVYADVVVRATGQATRQSLLSELPDVATDGRGRIIVDEEQRTSQPGVWAGGDCVNGGKEVVNAVAEGMAAARSIDEELRR
jgi:glutamate synthase (NADPH/NADH) small chain